MSYQITRPFDTEIKNTVRDMNKFFDKLMNELSLSPSTSLMNNSQPIVVHDDEHETHLNIDVPGVVKDNITVTYEGHHLKWEAHRENETQQEDGSKTKSVYDFSGMYHLQYVPTEVNATLNNGVLELIVTKPEETVETVVDVNVA